MIQLIYTSIAATDMPPGEVFRIVEKSAANNARDELSGFLLFQEGRFFQLVEGPETAIDGLLRKLEGDRRHHSIEILDRKPIEQRHFGKWSMKRLPAGADYASFGAIAPELDSAPVGVTAAVRRFLAGSAPLPSAA